jgi:SAM-dependent methyltransferase
MQYGLWVFHILFAGLNPLKATALYTAVPPSSNPKSYINKQFFNQLDRLVELERIGDGRVWFNVEDFSQLSRLNARSVRIVALETHNITEDDDEFSVCSSLSANSRIDFSSTIDTWKAMGNIIHDSDDVSFSITCSMWKSCICPELSCSRLSQVVAKQLEQEFDWTHVRKSDKPMYKFHLLLYECSAILELLALDRPLATDELPRPGFKLVESFALAKSAEIKPNEVVLDPMCGRATFLIEAAKFWPLAFYQGTDISDTQLQYAKENCQAAKMPVELLYADARKLTHLKDSSVDKIISCPPFGRQFDKVSENLYEELLLEWSRVLKDTGRMALLLDMANLPSMTEAIEKANCQIEFCRSPSFRLGKIRATILLVSKASTISKDEGRLREGKLRWETRDDSGRATWATMRSEALPSLIPYSLTVTK